MTLHCIVLLYLAYPQIPWHYRRAQRQRDRQTDRPAGRQAGRRTDPQMGRQTDRQPACLAACLPGWLAGRQAHRQTEGDDWQTDRQTVMKCVTYRTCIAYITTTDSNNKCSTSITRRPDITYIPYVTSSTDISTLHAIQALPYMALRCYT